MGGNLPNVQIDHLDANHTKGGMRNWNEFCMHATTEVWGSSDVSKMPEKLEQLVLYARQGMKDRLEIELLNIYQSYYNALTLTNWEVLSYASLVVGINGVDVKDLPVEEKAEMLTKLLTVKEIKDNISSVKKKLKEIFKGSHHLRKMMGNI